MAGESKSQREALLRALAPPAMTTEAGVTQK